MLTKAYIVVYIIRIDVTRSARDWSLRVCSARALLLSVDYHSRLKESHLRESFLKCDTYYMPTKEPRIAVTLSPDEHRVLALAMVKYDLTKAKIVAFIVRDWIAENRAELEKKGRGQYERKPTV